MVLLIVISLAKGEIHISANLVAIASALLNLSNRFHYDGRLEEALTAGQVQSNYTEI